MSAQTQTLFASESTAIEEHRKEQIEREKLSGVMKGEPNHRAMSPQKIHRALRLPTQKEKNPRVASNRNLVALVEASNTERKKARHKKKKNVTFADSKGLELVDIVNVESYKMFNDYIGKRDEKSYNRRASCNCACLII